jgi:hypothetical protein
MEIQAVATQQALASVAILVAVQAIVVEHGVMRIYSNLAS